MHANVTVPLQGGLPFLSNPSTTTGAGPTTLQQGPVLLPPGSITGAHYIYAWPVLQPGCLPMIMQMPEWPAVMAAQRQAGHK